MQKRYLFKDYREIAFLNFLPNYLCPALLTLKMLILTRYKGFNDFKNVYKYHLMRRARIIRYYFMLPHFSSGSKWSDHIFWPFERRCMCISISHRGSKIAPAVIFCKIIFRIRIYVCEGNSMIFLVGRNLLDHCGMLPFQMSFWRP